MTKFKVFLIGELEAGTIEKARKKLRGELSECNIKFFIDEGNDRIFCNDDLMFINKDIKELVKLRDTEELNKETILYFLNNKNGSS